MGGGECGSISKHAQHPFATVAATPPRQCGNRLRAPTQVRLAVFASPSLALPSGAGNRFESVRRPPIAGPLTNSWRRGADRL